VKNFVILFATLSAVIVASEVHGYPFADQDLSCVVTSDNKKYHDIFVIEVREKGFSSLKYVRIHPAPPKDRDDDFKYDELETVRGCSNAVQVKNTHYPERIEILCDNGGDDGSVSINPDLSGEIYFYMPQIGYPERTLLEIACKEI